MKITCNILFKDNKCIEVVDCVLDSFVENGWLLIKRDKDGILEWVCYNLDTVKKYWKTIE